MESKGRIKITGVRPCRSFMRADDILQQYVYSTIQHNTIQFYQRMFSVLLFFYGKPVIIIVSYICILFWSVLSLKFGV